MRTLTLLSIYFLAFSNVAPSCSSDSGLEEFEENPQVSSLIYGKSFGFCLGYCQQEVQFDSDGYSARSWSREKSEDYPDRTKEHKYQRKSWDRLLGFLNTSYIQEADSVIGCPDCADGGAEYIEIRSADFRKRITFENGNAPKELEALVLQIYSTYEPFD